METRLSPHSRRIPTLKISEHFYSLQGEGIYSGVPSYFIRFFGCSLQCQGFGQKNPADKSTWVQPWKDIDISKIEFIKDLPQEIYQYGCDSVYSWAVKFKDMQTEYEADELLDQIPQLDAIAAGKVHIIFTGGEPMLKFNQDAMVEIINALLARYPDARPNITIETNGTMNVYQPLKDLIASDRFNLLFSCSPKLLHTSGEPASRAIKPDKVRTYKVHDKVMLLGKFVVANHDAAKQEFLEVAKLYDFMDAIYLMPEGPNKHRVNDSATEIAEFAMAHGYRFTHRLHNLLWNNKIGV